MSREEEGGVKRVKETRLERREYDEGRRGSMRDKEGGRKSRSKTREEEEEE